MMKLAGKKVLVAGLGKSGLALAEFLVSRKARVIISDSAPAEQLSEYLAAIETLKLKSDLKIELGIHNPASFNQADLIILSPGVPHTIKAVVKAKQRGVPVIGEIELASRFIHQPIIAVTGTNGKTTTTELIGDMLKKSGLKVFVGGNIGRPLTGYVNKKQIAQIIIAEVSSFQLDTISTFRPKIAVLLNIARDHLNRYQDFKDYIYSKGKIFSNQQSTDTAIYNGEDQIILDLCRHIKSRKIPFFAGSVSKYQDKPYAVLESSSLIIHHAPNQISEIDLAGCRLKGIHNLENIAAASLAALAAGASPDGIKAAVNSFQGGPHRLEDIAVIDQVRYINDSKATNPAAVIRALECFNQPVILIMGGRNKGNDFSDLKEAIHRFSKKVVVFGEARQEIIKAIEDNHSIRAIAADSMEDAVVKASRLSLPGDVVLLSPACASFDMFDGYAQRGEAFNLAVEKLK